ncbi:retrotransposon protein, putative, ty1-copia subclass [Tanacetum coccineum]
MHSMGKSIVELHAMLKLHEKGILKKAETPAVLAIREGKIQKDKKKPQGEKDNPAKDSVCHHHKEVGHWKRNCLSYQAELKKRKNDSIASTLGIFTIELYGLRGSIKLKHGALSLYVGNGMRAAVEVIGSFDLVLPNDFSHYGYVYLMKHKHEVFETFKVFQNEVENKLGEKIKAIRFDRGGKYLSHEFVNHMKSCGIVSQLTPPYTPQHNGVYKRRNQTLLDMVRSMMNLTALPKSFWGYDIESVVRILNMVPTKKVCEALVKRDMPDKLDPRSIKCIFVGYPKKTMGYYFYYPLENKIFVARNAEFFENSLMVQEASGSHGLLESSGSDEGLELVQEEDT